MMDLHDSYTFFLEFRFPHSWISSIPDLHSQIFRFLDIQISCWIASFLGWLDLREHCSGTARRQLPRDQMWELPGTRPAPPGPLQQSCLGNKIMFAYMYIISLSLLLTLSVSLSICIFVYIYIYTFNNISLFYLCTCTNIYI